MYMYWQGDCNNLPSMSEDWGNHGDGANFTGKGKLLMNYSSFFLWEHENCCLGTKR